MDKRLLQTRNDIFKKCPSIFWEVSIFAIVIAVALVALDAVVPGFVIITFPFIFFPVLFATFMTLYSIKYGGTVSLKSTYAISLTYFKRNNFGCFRIIKSFFHAFLVELLLSMIIAMTLHAVFTDLYGEAFTTNIQAALDFLSNNDVEGFYNFMGTNNAATLYFGMVSAFSTSGAIIAFIYGICFNSINVYLSASIPNATMAFVTAVSNKFLRWNASRYRKDFWSLNWPLFALLLFGIVSGYAMVILLDIDFTYALTISTMLGLLLMIPVAPLFFANMEALFAKYSEDMKRASTDLTTGFLRNIKENANLSEEDRKKIDELLSKGKDDDESQGK